MEENWHLDRVEIRGGFLQEIDLSLPPGLTCIIGPRGSGKSTFAEAVRYGMAGLENAPKSRVDLYRANLAKAVVMLHTSPSADGNSYSIRREGRQQAILTTTDGRVLSSVDLDRGTFLPFEGYSSAEIEEIAEERLGPKRRTLLDDLRPNDVLSSLAQLSAAKRELAANADEVRAQRRAIEGLNEQIQMLADAPDRLAALGPAPDDGNDTTALQEAAGQDQMNRSEKKYVEDLTVSLTELAKFAEEFIATFDLKLSQSVTVENSQNRNVTAQVDQKVTHLLDTVRPNISAIREAIALASAHITPVAEQLDHAHLEQRAAYARLREENKAVGEAFRERADAEDAVRRLSELRQQKQEVIKSASRLTDVRKSLRGRYVQLCQHLSELRECVAKELDQEAGDNVRIRVRRNADKLEYQQKINEALYGAGVRNHDSIVERVSRLSPDELAQILTERDYIEFESICQLGAERSQRVVDALRSYFDPLELEVMRMEDMISIELNVGSSASPVYKDASELSRGQKCTALLPLLLARRRTPLIIDQPEDNLDNNFIFRTVVETIRRLKHTRQMVFITHNANIPVLGEAELVIVMGSDGRVGRIEKQGTLDECQKEIIDLLEGGREAFDQRRQRYER